MKNKIAIIVFEKIGDGPELVDEILEFSLQDHILKSGKLSAFVNDFLIDNMKEIAGGELKMYLRIEKGDII